MAMKSGSRKVSIACERCRRQKLKCDVQRPCTLCARADVECITSQPQKWRFHHPPQKESSTGSGEPGPKRRRLRTPRDESMSGSLPGSGPDGLSTSELLDPSPNGGGDDCSTKHTPWNTSSTIGLVEEAFQRHEVPSPEDTETSALLASTWAHPIARSSSQRPSEGVPSPLQRLVSQHLQNVHSRRAARQSDFSIAEQELSLLLPELPAATILVNNYFDRIHWFTLLFHQRAFRHKFQSLYDSGPEHHHTSNGRFGHVAVFLAVIATSLHYTNVEQKQQLKSHGIEPESLKDKILIALKSRFLDIISVGSLEVVQMCILLGSYYIYHGQPEIAWPLCGTGLRIAQALNLHREIPQDNDNESFRQIVEDRKRAWWAIYEIEIFCSMLYGFPPSISDSDCDVARLDPYDEYSGSISKEQHAVKPNLLFFKCAMSELSSIVKDTLDNLYRAPSGENQQGTDYASRLRRLVNKVECLSHKLLKWNERLDTKLRFDGVATESTTSDPPTHSSEVSDTSFEEHLFRLQALSLKLAYENARILIHRPLLSFRVLQTSAVCQDDPLGRNDPFQTAMRTCRDAALQISRVGLDSFQEASETYAISFVSLHLLTAGVTLCISITLNPLSKEAYESRMGIRRLMQIQSLLRDKSVVAGQGLEITKRLMSLVMAKEVDAMFEVGSLTELAERPPTNSSAAASEGHCVNRQPTQPARERIPPQLVEDLPPTTDGAAHLLGTSTVAHEVETDCRTQDFCENTSLAEAVLEYEQAVRNPLNTYSSNIPVSFSNQNDTFLGDPFLSQEQGWIWGWNFLE